MAASAYLWSNGAAGLVLSVLSDRMNRKKLLYTLSLGAAVLAFVVGNVSGGVLWLCLLMLGIFFGGVTPIVLVLPLEAEGIESEQIGTAMGIMLGFGHLGGVVFPIVAGIIADVYHSFLGVFACAALALGLIPLCASRVKKREIN